MPALAMPALTMPAVPTVFVLLLSALLCLCPSGAADAAQRLALLVGVTDYPNLDPLDRLEGPANDVALVSRIVKEAGFAPDAVTILADEVAGASGQPTRRAILDALSGIAGRAGSGDFVFLYFAGHGAQQPSSSAKARKEADGLDEIFLPLDTMPAGGAGAARADGVGAGQGVINAILDAELGDAVTAIRRRGAFVWIVMDSCHSAGSLRAVPPSALPPPAKQHDRTVPAGRLGLGGSPAPDLTAGKPADRPGSGAPTRLRSSAEAGPGDRALGDYVAFFASQSRETTKEMVPAWGTEGQAVHGVFTAALAEALASGHAMSYRTLAEQVLYRYRADNRFDITPAVEGTALDAPVFGSRPGPEKRFWPLSFDDRGGTRTASIAAGRLHGVDEGSVVAILREPADEQPLGHAEVTRADAFGSVLTPVPRDRKAALRWADVPDGAVARLETARLRFDLRVARPPMTDKPRTPAEKRLFDAVEDLARSPTVAGVTVHWVDATQSAKLRLFVQSDRLWLLTPSMALVTSGPQATPSIKGDADPAAIRQSLADSVRQVAKVANLAQMGQMFSFTRVTRAVHLTTTVLKAGGSPTTLDSLNPATLTDGDTVTFHLTNEGTKDVDVTALFVDAGYGVKALYPDAGEDNRLPGGGTVSLTLDIQTRNPDGTTSALGPEGVFFLMTEAAAKEMRTDFTFLEQPAMPKTRALARPSDTAEPSFDALVSAAAFGTGATRGTSQAMLGITNGASIRFVGWRSAE